MFMTGNTMVVVVAVCRDDGDDEEEKVAFADVETVGWVGLAVVMMRMGSTPLGRTVPTPPLPPPPRVTTVGFTTRRGLICGWLGTEMGGCIRRVEHFVQFCHYLRLHVYII